MCDARYGHFLYNKYDTPISKCIEHYGEYGEGEIALFRQFLKPGDTIIEAGGNIGTHTLPLAQLVGAHGKVFSFEAQRILFQMLCANLALNSIINVYAYPYAVGTKNGMITVPDIPYGKPTNLGAYSLMDQRGREMVPSITLDTFFRGNTQIAFIMADIEKMEAELLKGAKNLIRDVRPLLYLECHADTPQGRETLHLLHAWKYRVFWHVVNTYNPNNYRRCKYIASGTNTAAFNILAVPAERTLECTQTLKEILPPA